MKNYTFRQDLDTYTLRDLCIKNDWFTSGTSEQYEKLFDLNNAGAPVESLAAIIWTCSEGVELAEITEALQNVCRWPIWIDCLERTLQQAEFGETEREIIRQCIITHPDAGKAFRVVYNSEE